MAKEVSLINRLEFGNATIPTFTHDEWLTYSQTVPKGALCASIDDTGQANLFVGDGIHQYKDLIKTSTKPKIASAGDVFKSTVTDEMMTPYTMSIWFKDTFTYMVKTVADVKIETEEEGATGYFTDVSITLNPVMPNANYLLQILKTEYDGNSVEAELTEKKKGSIKFRLTSETKVEDGKDFKVEAFIMRVPSV